MPVSSNDLSFLSFKLRAVWIAMSVEGEFFLSITGSIEHAEFYDINNAYCKYGFHCGPEWTVVAVSHLFFNSSRKWHTTKRKKKRNDI